MSSKEYKSSCRDGSGLPGQEDLFQIFHGVNEALFIHDRKGRILELNQRAMQMF
ncbi:PAS domain-containing protein, partial [Desulfonatronospira sp. MSAO_Bac3]|uniref:PAS domain-containing protein n=1 Tax=Desulfonatronospira sp. MSAO_Bac3 TaxID=2293857 RepID=UPI000FECEAD1